MAFAVVDVDYTGPGATAACVVGDRWSDPAPIETHTLVLTEVAPYVAGRFFERELPCIVAVLSRVVTPIDTVVIDGYVVLDTEGTGGLGAHLHAALGGRCAVIGVAKTAFGDASFATPVLRGTSRRALYVTAAGIDVGVAAQRITAMHGPHRIPTLLGWVDRLAAGDPPAWPGC